MNEQFTDRVREIAGLLLEIQSDTDYSDNHRAKAESHRKKAEEYEAEIAKTQAKIDILQEEVRKITNGEALEPPSAPEPVAEVVVQEPEPPEPQPEEIGRAD